MTKFFIHWIINAVALYLAVQIVPGVYLSRNIETILWLALIFWLVHESIGRLLKFLGCLINLLTLGLYTLFVNTFLFWLTGQIGQFMGIDIKINGFWPALLGALIISIFSVVMEKILKKELK